MQNYSITNKENYYAFDSFKSAKKDNTNSETSLFLNDYNTDKSKRHNSVSSDNIFSSNKSHFDDYSVFDLKNNDYSESNIASLYEYSNLENTSNVISQNNDFYKIFNGVKELFNNN